jgi:recombinational DNA repair protein RecR
MTRKCGFIDCKNPAEKKTIYCQSCKERKEKNICSACRQPESKQGQTLNHVEGFFKEKNYYEYVTKLRGKFSSQFHPEIDQILPQFKLSDSEKELIDKMKKVITDFLTEKGGKQDEID